MQFNSILSGPSAVLALALTSLFSVSVWADSASKLLMDSNNLIVKCELKTEAGKNLTVRFVRSPRKDGSIAFTQGVSPGEGSLELDEVIAGQVIDGYSDPAFSSYSWTEIRNKPLQMEDVGDYSLIHELLNETYESVRTKGVLVISKSDPRQVRFEYEAERSVLHSHVPNLGGKSLPAINGTATGECTYY